MKSFAIALAAAIAFALFHSAMRADQRALCERTDEVQCPEEVPSWLK